MRIVAIAAASLAVVATALFHAPTVRAEASQTNTVTNHHIVVAKGDTLEKIAGAHGTTYLRLFYANTDIKHPDMIYPDQKLRVPAADEQLAERLVEASYVPAQSKPVAKTYKNPTFALKPKAASKPKVVAAAPVAGGGVWDQLAKCESGG